MMITTITMIRTYSELIQIDDYYDRYEYLRLSGKVADPTFDRLRYINQAFYASYQWRKLRNKVIIRDGGCDMAHEDYEIPGRIYIHHLNPVTPEDLETDSEFVWDPEFLVCVAFDTHNAIHYGDDTLLPQPLVERRPGDTCPWK